jgi:poly(3-hydroxybutyrate) depolymerase
VSASREFTVMKRWISLGAWLGVAFTAAVATVVLEPRARPPRPAAPTGTGARVERKTYAFKEAGGRETEYALFVPSTYDKARRWPLVIALHGLHSNPQEIIHYAGLTDQAERHGFVVAAPMGYNPHGWYGAHKIMGTEPDDPPNLSELSERDVMNVLEIVRADYAIDPDRIYLLGHSMGGGGAFHLAIKYPDVWAGLAAVAPAPVLPAGDAAKFRHLPVILVQGAKDESVNVEWTRPWAREMSKLGMAHEYIEYPQGDHVHVAFEAMPRIFEFLDKHSRGGGADRAKGRDAKERSRNVSSSSRRRPPE